MKTSVDYEHCIPVRIKIEGENITVDYSPGGAADVYVDKAAAEGKDWLCRQEGGDSGTLHDVPRHNLLEGFWDEGEARGTWRLDIEEPALVGP